MAHRSIHDSVAISRSLAGLSHGAERLWWRLLAQSDPYGRLPGEPDKVRAKCCPLLQVTDDEVAAWLSEIDDAGRIVGYHDGRDRFVQIVDFDEYQTSEFLRKRGKSRFPDVGSEEVTREKAGVRPSYAALRADNAAPSPATAALTPETPANGHHAGVRADNAGLTPPKAGLRAAQNRMEENGIEEPEAVPTGLERARQLGANGPGSQSQEDEVPW